MPPEKRPTVRSHLNHYTSVKYPLHFLAQISLDEVPRDFLGGLLPKTGALLFFGNLCQGFDSYDSSSDAKVLYIPTDGPERQPPLGMKPIRDPDYSGFPFDVVSGAIENWPFVVRKWPVDLISADDHAYRPIGNSLIDFHPGEADDQIFEKEGDLLKILQDLPLTSSVCLRLIELALRNLKSIVKSSEKVDDQEKDFLSRLQEHDFFSNLLDELDKKDIDPNAIIAKFLAHERGEDVAAPVPTQSGYEYALGELAHTNETRSLIKQKQQNSDYESEIKEHFDILRASVVWACGLIEELENAHSYISKGHLESEVENVRNILTKENFASRHFWRKVQSKEKLLTPFPDNRYSLITILKDALVGQYSMMDGPLDGLLSLKQMTETYLMAVKNVHRMGELHKDYDPFDDKEHILLLQLADDPSLQLSFNYRLMFTMRREDLANLDFSNLNMFVCQ